MADTGATLISQGQWLGIDVGSNPKKVFSFCLIESDGKGQVDVLFEAGKARGAAHGQPFPPSKAGVFEDLRRSTWLSEAAELGSVQVLDESALVKAWNAARKLGKGRFGVCIDAPCGFAVPGTKQRNTEMESYGTPPLMEFLKRMTELSALAIAGDKGKNTPLRQQFFWKLIGLVAFRYFVALTTSRPFGMPIPELTASCMASEEARVREGFPSDTYKRSNGRFGVLCPAPRWVLARLSQAKWADQGNCFNGSTSAPHPGRMKSLIGHQGRLIADLQRAASHAGPVPEMKKISNAWGDLWDAFTCAFVSCCDAQGCAGFVCSDIARCHLEGAILRPDYCPAPVDSRRRTRATRSADT